MRRRVTALAVLALVVAGCGIENDTGPRNVSPGDGLQEQPDEVPTTRPAGNSSVRLYLLTPPVGTESERLAPVVRRLDPDASALFQALVTGPLPDDPDNLHTGLPAGVTLLLPPRVANRVLTLDVSKEIFAATGPTLIEALAQIVFTMTELDSIDSVAITVEGETRDWPTGDGSLTRDPITRYDYPELNPTSQPDYPAAPAPAPVTT